MMITARELKSLAKFVFEQTDEKKVAGERHDDFLDWANKAIDSYRGSGQFEVPVLYQGLYRTFQKSRGYDPGIEEIVLEAEQRANPPVYEGPQQDQPFRLHNRRDYI